MTETPNTSQTMLVTTTMVLSLMAIYYLWQKHAKGQPLLAYEPRRSVPWNLLAPFALILIPSLIASLLIERPEDKENVSPAEFIYQGWMNSGIVLSVVLVSIACLATFLRADKKDLGISLSLPQIGKDCWLGLFACLATMLPIAVISITLTFFFEPQQQNPLIEQLQKTFSPQMALVGIVLAVVVAPIFEEFTFRLLFQGWLEKWEDHNIGFTATERDPEMQDEQPEMSRPAHGLIPELPHGWIPILVSGLLFGFAHFGHGIAPVPLTLLGIVLGYLYQRTHRLLPCIVAHMLFNSFTMVLIWLQFSKPPV